MVLIEKQETVQMDNARLAKELVKLAKEISGGSREGRSRKSGSRVTYLAREAGDDLELLVRVAMKDEDNPGRVILNAGKEVSARLKEVEKMGFDFDLVSGWSAEARTLGVEQLYVIYDAAKAGEPAKKIMDILELGR